MFTPKITNPIKNNVPATEIQLNDRLITNNELKDFFVNIPKRIEIIEKADDVSDNLDALALTNDVNDCKSNIDDLQEDVTTISESIDELQEMMGAKSISGTVQYRLNEIWNVIYGTDGLIEYITEVQDDYLNTKNNDLVEMKSDIDYNKSKIEDHDDVLDEHLDRIIDVENKCAQIDVNEAEVKVMQAQIKSMQAQIEQIRTECNNYLSECWKAIDALRAFH